MFNITVKNRFTGRILERHSNKSLNFLFETQDVYMLAFWIKVEAIEVKLSGKTN